MRTPAQLRSDTPTLSAGHLASSRGRSVGFVRKDVGTLAGMNVTLALVAIGIVAFFVLIYFAVNTLGTRLTGKQIDEDPDVRRHVDPEHRDEDFPIDSQF